MRNEKSNLSYRDLFSGPDTPVPLLSGSQKSYINLDNAASTPPLAGVRQAVDSFLEYYSSVHRGTGFKSQLATHAYEAARISTLRFVGADPSEHTCIFGKNATEAINKLARRFPFTPERNIVLVSGLEHHSNDLPWRSAARVVHIGLTAEGKIDEQDYGALLQRYAGQIALVAVSGASNVTCYITPLHELANQAHAIGAQIMADCAQLAPHRRIDMRPLEDPGHLDYLALSAHKMYAPFGTGALVGRTDTFDHGEPDMRGGGTVEIVTLDEVVWAGAPERDEAGSPNTVGAVALAAAIHQLERVGMEQVAQHEAELTAYALQELPGVPGIKIYGDCDPARAASRLGVIPFALEGISHFKVAAILGYEFGIGVRSGCFCAHPYILHLLRLTDTQAKAVRERMLAGDRSELPGLIRASFGLYNTEADVKSLVEALRSISRGEYQGNYVQERSSGEYTPLEWQPDFSSYFQW